MKEMSLPYSVIVPAYQEADVIGECVRAVADQTIPRSDYEIIVVDDASTDATIDAAREAGADRVLRIEHGGPAAARNAGLAVAQGDLILFTDADCAPPREWMARMAAPFSDADVVGTKGSYRTRQRSLIARLVQLEFEIRYERMAVLPKIDFIDTYAACYRGALLAAEGGFNTDYVAAEDVDLSFRLAQKGYDMVFVPDAWVWHIHPDSLTSYLRRKGRFGYWRALLYMRYPNKIAGDTHTDPALKAQFLIVALMMLLGVGALFWWPLWIAVIILLGAFLVTTLRFVRWAWSRDRAVALAWPVVTFLRVLVQGVGLVVGLSAHLLHR